MPAFLDLVLKCALLALFLLEAGYRPWRRKQALHEEGEWLSGFMLLASLFLALLFGGLLAPLPVARFDGPWLVQLVALLFVLAGLILRIAAGQALGGAYHRRLHIAADQKLVQRGAYGLVRHPGLLGLLLAWFGAALEMGNLPGFLACLIVAASGIVYRACLEERLLALHFDEEFHMYARKSWVLLPYIW